MQIKVFRIDTTKDFRREKTYNQVDITSQVQQPIMDVERLDTTLDSSSLTILNKDSEPIKPFTRFKFIIADDGVAFDDYGNKLSGNGEVQVIYRIVYSDSPSIVNWSKVLNKVIYQHQVELLEITKLLERFDVDNTTITNYLMFLYSDVELYLPEIVGYNYKFSWAKYQGVIIPIFPKIENINYDNTDETRIVNIYKLNAQENIDVKLKVNVSANVVGFIPVIETQTLETFEIQTPTKTYNLKDTSASNYRNPKTFIFDEVGQYKITQVYSKYDGLYETHATFTWITNCKEFEDIIVEKKPQKKTIREVIDKILGNITSESSIALKNETPLFQLDANLIDKLSAINSAEFTFTQNTLFGVLMEIGQYIHAIPRLLPNKTLDNENKVVDDVSAWNIISFDFWGDYTQGDFGKVITRENSINGDNYTSAYVSNVENSFNENEEYITSMVEPFTGGYISTRTESANFEISNNECVIKTSRPIQRITELICGFYDKDNHFREIDIAQYVKESADYNLLNDYATNETLTLGTKSTALYYTRGDNTIRGLTYIAPTELFQTETFSKHPAILNILQVITGQSYFITSNSYWLKNLMFNIKYVPYYSFKLKQYKPIIDEQSGANNLYYNQASQSVDIEAFGENMKGALMQVGNNEQSITALYTKLDKIMKAGQMGDENYFAYQVNKEITNSGISTTTMFSKDWNKWNEYVAIKKNYREWEISEKESVKQNPIYNDFAIISDEIDIDKIEEVPSTNENYEALKSQWEKYADELDTTEMFCNIKSANYLMASMIEKPFNAIGSLRWLIGKTTQKEWNTTSFKYENVSHSFMLPIGCFSVGNSIVITASATDNYSIGTFVKEDEVNFQTGFAVEEYLEYGNKYGEANEMECYFGAYNYFDEPFDIQPLDNSKYLYKVDMNKVQEVGSIFEPSTRTMLQIKNNPLLLNKDSRQQINLTFQLNFVSEKDYIWIGSALAKNTFFVGTTNPSLRVAYFKRKPNKFLAEKMVENVDYVIGGQIKGVSSVYLTKYGRQVDTKAIAFDTQDRDIATTRSVEYVGAGLIDTNGNIVLYYNKALGQRERMPLLYFQYRRKI